MGHDAQSQAADSPDVGHIVSFKLLLAVIASLLVLTWLTVAAAHYDFGQISIWVALGIATVKAVLVSMYFMHLRYDTTFHGLIFYLALGFVVLFIYLTTTDSTQYQNNVDAFRVEFKDVAPQ